MQLDSNLVHKIRGLVYVSLIMWFLKNKKNSPLFLISFYLYISICICDHPRKKDKLVFIKLQL